MKKRLKHLPVGLIILVVVLILILSFFVYEGMRNEELEEETYMVDEVVQEEDIVPDETESPAIEQTEEEVQIMNEVIVEIRDLKFVPEKVTISPGTTVIWVNNDNSPHKVVAYDRLFYGPRMNPGDIYSFTFTKEGTHRYFDAVFPKIGRGRVIVKEEPLPITGGVVGVDLGEQEESAKFALLVLMFVIMILALSHGIHNHYK